MLALDLVERLRAVSPQAANLILSKALPQLIPFAGGMGMRVEEVTSLRSRACIPLKRRTRNHVGSIYFGAQMTLMELTMGVLFFKRYPPGPYGLLVKRVEADFHSKAKTAVSALCEPDLELFRSLDAGLATPEGKAEGWAPVRLLARDSSVVTEARFLIALKRFAPAH